MQQQASSPYQREQIRETNMRKFTVVLMFVLAMLPMSGSPASAQGSSHYFPETGHTVKGRFLQYWQQHGGLAQQGYPISDELQGRSETDGKLYTVQYFERTMFEYHAENQPPNDVLLSLLGNFRYKLKYPNGAPGQQASTDNPGLFPETGMTVGGKFRIYWEQHGSLAQQGYPISNEFQGAGTDGITRTVQYFERAVFELHPENAGTPYEVLLTQLGTLRYHAAIPTETLYSLSMASPHEGWAVGDKGAILHYTGGRWQQVANPLRDDSYLLSVSMVSPDEGWAVGAGVMLHYTGGKWQEETNVPSLLDHFRGRPWPRLIAISMASADEGWAITGDSAGRFLHYSGGTWSWDYQDSYGSLLTNVQMTSAQEGWAFGVYDILHYNGTRWVISQSLGELNESTSALLNRLSMVSASDGWAVGAQGVILHYDGARWNQVASPTNVSLNDVEMLSANDGWVVGGTILHYNGSTWTVHSSPTNKGLTAIRMVSPTEGWAVGEAGTIMHYQNGTWSVYQQ